MDSLGSPGCLTKHLSPATPGHFTWGNQSLRVLSRKSLGLLLWGQDFVYFLQCLSAAEKQERVITFEFLPFAFKSLPPPQRSSLKTGSVYKAVGVFIYHCSSLEEDSRVRCLLLGAFIILTLTMAEKVIHNCAKGNVASRGPRFWGPKAELWSTWLGGCQVSIDVMITSKFEVYNSDLLPKRQSHDTWALREWREISLIFSRRSFGYDFLGDDDPWWLNYKEIWIC